MDRIVLHGLGVPLETAFEYLYSQRPDFNTFEDWILQCNGGDCDPATVARINSAIVRLRNTSAAMLAAPSANSVLTQFPEPVLSAADWNHWNEHGYVIVHDAISSSACTATEAAIWEHLGMDPDDPASWYSKPRSHGIMVQFYHHKALAQNRRSARIQQAFAELWGTTDIWTTIDRVSFNPPESKHWRFPGPRLHWDVSLEPPMTFGVQGLLYLSDTSAEQGAFSCVPGFHRTVDDWVKSLPAGVNPREQDMESLGAKPVSGRAGDLVIWHQALPHGSRPNTAARPRLVQYIATYPTVKEYQPRWR